MNFEKYIFHGLSFIRLLSKLLDAHFFFFFMATSLYERLIPYFNKAPCHRPSAIVLSGLESIKMLIALESYGFQAIIPTQASKKSRVHSQRE
jgi:hypothetical protein